MSQTIEVDFSGRRTRNLKVLQAIDERVLEIVCEGSHVAVYKFLESKWQREEVEGPIFITRNCSAPLYSLIVLNKKGPMDFQLCLSDMIRSRIQEEYVMMQCKQQGPPSTAPVVYGLWFYQPEERESFHNSLKKLLDGTQGSADNLTEKLAKLISKKSVGDHPPVATTTQATVDSTKNAAVMSSSEKAKVLQSIFKASQQIEAVGEASVVQSHITASTTTVSRKADQTKAFSSTNSSDRVVESSEKTKQLKSLLVKSSADQVAPKPPSTASSEKAPAAEPVAESKAKSLLSMLKAAPSKPIETASATNDDLLTDGEIAARKKQAVVANQSKKLIDNVVSTTVNDSVTPVNNNQKLRRVELSFSSGPKPSSTTSIDFLSEGVRKIEVSELFAKAKSVARVNEHAPVISKSEKVSAKPKLISPSDLI